MGRAACVVMILAFAARGYCEEKKRNSSLPPLTSQQEKDAVARYGKIPADATAILKNLRKLKALTKAGVSYAEYRDPVKSVCVDCDLFLESPEAKRLYELATVLDEACKSYGKVARIWNKSLFGETARDRSGAEFLLDYSRDRYWSLASTDLLCAKLLTSGDSREIVRAINAMRKDYDRFRVSALEATIYEELTHEKEKHANAEKLAQRNKELEEEDERAKQVAEAGRWREWTKQDGTKLGRCRFSGLGGGLVTLQDGKGKKQKIRFDDLSKADQQWIKQRARGK